MNVLAAITTFRRNDALTACIASLANNSYLCGDCHVVICDDEDGNSKAIFTQFQPSINELSYVTGPNAGIAINKNRGIEFFLKNDFEFLFLCDDDLLFKAPGLFAALIECCRSNGILSVTTYIEQYKDPLSGKGFFFTFPIKAVGDNVAWCNGTQGIGLFFHRDIVKQAGYFYTGWKSKYGYEHAEYSARCNKLEGRQPELFPIFTQSPKYIECQPIASRYSTKDDAYDPALNAPIYQQRLRLIYEGKELLQMNPDGTMNRVLAAF